MTTLFHKLALASAAVCMASAAQAAMVKWTVSIDFETYGQNGEPVEVYSGTEYPTGQSAGSYGQVGFSTGFLIYPFATSGKLEEPKSNGSNGYLSNLATNPPGAADEVSITIDEALNIEFLAFDFSYAAAPGVTLVGKKGRSTQTYVDGKWVWSESFFEMSKLVGISGETGIGVLTSIEFRNASSGTYFALDNLRLGVTDTDTGGTVPEPSGVALVALALAAAASASGRVRRGRWNR